MPEVIDAPPPAEESTTVAEPGNTNFGDKFRTAMAAKEKNAKNKPEKSAKPAPKDKKPGPKEEKPGDAKEKVDTTAKKPSAIDIALAEEKPAAEKEQAQPEKEGVEDPLKEFDEKKPDWERAREVMRTQSEEKKTLRTELEKAKEQLGKVDPKLAETLTVTAKERDELKAKNGELLDVITKINVKYSPDYQEKFVKGREKLLERAVTRVKEYGGDVDKFSDALSLTGKHRTAALKEALEQVDDLDKPRIISVLDDIQKLDDEAHDLESNPQQAFEALESKRAEDRQRLAADAERALKTTLEKTAAELRTKSPLLRTVDPATEDGPAWNDEVKAAFAGAERMFGPDATVQEQFERTVKGFRYDGLEKMFLANRQELKAANARLREYDEAAPDFKGGKKPADTVVKTPAEKYHAAMAAATGGDDDGV